MAHRGRHVRQLHDGGSGIRTRLSGNPGCLKQGVALNRDRSRCAWARRRSAGKGPPCQQPGDVADILHLLEGLPAARTAAGCLVSAAPDARNRRTSRTAPRSTAGCRRRGRRAHRCARATTRPSFRVTRTSAPNCSAASSGMSGCGRAVVSGAARGPAPPYARRPRSRAGAPPRRRARGPSTYWIENLAASGVRGSGLSVCGRRRRMRQDLDALAQRRPSRPPRARSASIMAMAGCVRAAAGELLEAHARPARSPSGAPQSSNIRSGR